VTNTPFFTREEEGFGSESTSHWQPNGVGMSDSLLFHEQGAVGRALQTLAMRT